MQLGMLSKLQYRNKLEVLRIEVRLNKRNKMRHVFKAIGVKTDLTFKKLFKPAISKKILLHYLDELESKRPVLLDYKVKSDKALLADLVFNNPDLAPKQILQLFGLKQAMNVMSLREIRLLLSPHNKRSWYMLMNMANKVKLPIGHDTFGEVRKILTSFEALQLASYKINHSFE